MTFYTVFPNSPLSLSAISGDTGLDDPPSPSTSSASFPKTAIFNTPPNGNGSSASGFPPRRSPIWSPTSEKSGPSSPLSSSLSRSAARRRLSGCSFIGYSPTPNFGSLVGSYQESLLRGRMSMPASKPLTFDAEIGVLGLDKCKQSLKCPPHLNLQFPAHFYDLKAAAGSSDRDASSAVGSPYVGTIDIETHFYDQLLYPQIGGLSISADDSQTKTQVLPAFPGYRVPPKGQIQLVIKYPNLNAVKFFLVPYDLTDMPTGSKTFIRQKSMLVAPLPSSEASRAQEHLGGSSTAKSNLTPNRNSNREMLRYAVHLQFCSPPTRTPKSNRSQPGFDGNDKLSKVGTSHARKDAQKEPSSAHPKVYLHKTIRVVFAARALDSSEKLHDVIETPGDGENRYTSYAGPDDDWRKAYKEAKARQTHTPVGRQTGLGIGIASPTIPSSRLGSEPITMSVQSSSVVNYPSVLNSDPNGERWAGSLDHNPYTENRPTPVSSSFVSPSMAWSSGSSLETRCQGSLFSGYLRDNSSSVVNQMSLDADERTNHAEAVPPLPSNGRLWTSRDSFSGSAVPPSSSRPARVGAIEMEDTSAPSASDDDRALLEAWHQTWRRQPNLPPTRQAATCPSGRATPTLVRPMSPNRLEHKHLSGSSIIDSEISAEGTLEVQNSNTLQTDIQEPRPVIKYPSSSLLQKPSQPISSPPLIVKMEEEDLLLSIADNAIR